MVSAVHLTKPASPVTPTSHASKGLHMVSAVHRALGGQSGQTALASKGLHMVSAVHHLKPIDPSWEDVGFKGAAHG